MYNLIDWFDWTYERDILNTNELILLPVGTSRPQGKGIKRLT